VFIKYCYRPILMYRPEVGAQTMAYMNRPAAGQKRFLRSTDKKKIRENMKRRTWLSSEIYSKRTN
jgi:hypothetical protein